MGGATLELLAAPPPSALVAVAHPDDVDFGAGGTAAWIVAAGGRVGYVIATDGDAGGFDESVARDEIPGLRRREQREAAARTGVVDVRFLGFADGRLEPSLELRRELTAEIRRQRPEVVITQSPERNLDRVPSTHPDHRAVGQAALDAVYPDARNPFAFPELAALAAHVVHEVWIMGAPAPTHAIDVTEVVETKLAALAAHQSQLPDWPATSAMVREWLVAGAAAAGLPPGRLAETFRVVRIP
jgi:LmbE family N-acetylglucosaminyl deacetylase